MTSPFDDLLPLGYVDPRGPAGQFDICTRCGCAVWVAEDMRSEAEESHAAWHHAVEAAVPAPTHTEEFAPLRDQLIQQLLTETSIDENGLDVGRCVDLLMPLIEDWAGRYLSRATTAEAAASMPSDTQRALSLMTARYEREAARVDEYARDARTARDDLDRARTTIQQLDQRATRAETRNGELVQALQALQQRSDDLVGELRKQLEAAIKTVERQRRDVRTAMGATSIVPWSSMMRMIEESRVEGFWPGEIYRLRRVEDALVALGAPNSSTKDDPGGPMIAWIRDSLCSCDGIHDEDCGKRRVEPIAAGITLAQHAALLRVAAKGRRAYAQNAPDEQAKHLSHEYRIFEAAAGLLVNPRRLAGLIPTSMQTWSLDDDVAEIVAKATGIRMVWLGSQPEPAADPQRNAEVLTDQMLCDLLSLVGVTPTALQLQTWTPEQREQAANWAGLVHLDASDNDVDVPKRPAFLDALATLPDGKLLMSAQKMTATPPVRPGIDRPLTEQELAEIHQASGWGNAVQAAEWAAAGCRALRLDSAGVLHACTITDEHEVHKGTPGPDGMVEVWTSNVGIPRPWPQDREPPAGIDILGDLGAPPSGGTPYLVRGTRFDDRVPDDWWCWTTVREGLDQGDGRLGNRGPDWAVCAAQTRRELVVIRPDDQPVEQPSEVCPSLFLAPDGQLQPCNLAIELHLRPSSGPDDHWHAYLIDSPDGDATKWRWQGKDAVPVPWPLDQEPPPGINLLEDTGTTGDRVRFIRRRATGWSWEATTSSNSMNEVAPWQEITIGTEGDLHVVRPA